MKSIIYFILSIILAAHIQATLYPSSLVGYWKFDESSGLTAQDSANNYDGSLQGMNGTEWQAGKFGNALNFVGGDYVNLGNPSALNITGNFTMQAWIKTSSADSYSGIVSWGQHAMYEDRTMWLQAGTGKLALYFYATSNNQIVGTSDLRDNQWHHVVTTWDGSTGKVFVDGTLENSGALTAAAFNHTATYIGRNISGSYAFNGLIDDVGIWNQALNSSDIQSLYSSGVEGVYNPVPEPSTLLLLFLPLCIYLKKRLF